MPRKIRKLTQVCFFELVKDILFQIKMASFRQQSSEVVFSGQAPKNTVYVLAKTTQHTRSGKGPDNRGPETAHSTNISLCS